jgi:hypothetical protein
MMAAYSPNVMNAFPLPVRIAALAALVALPFNGEASATLLICTGLAAIASIDYPRRYRGLCVPRRPRTAAAVFRAPPIATERDRLAA